MEMTAADSCSHLEPLFSHPQVRGNKELQLRGAEVRLGVMNVILTPERVSLILPAIFLELPIVLFDYFIF